VKSKLLRCWGHLVNREPVFLSLLCLLIGCTAAHAQFGFNGQRLFQPGIYPNDAREGIYIHREAFPANEPNENYQLLLLASYVEKEGVSYKFHADRVVRSYPYKNKHRTTFFRMVDDQGLHAVYFIKNGYVWIDRSASGIFTFDESAAYLCFTGQLLTSFYTGWIVGSEMAAYVYGTAVRAYGPTQIVSHASTAVSMLYGISSGIAAEEITRNATEKIDRQLVFQANESLDDALDRIDINEFEKISFRFNAEGANVTDLKFIMGSEIDGTSFQNGEVILDRDISVLSIAKKMRCLFGTLSCNGYAKDHGNEFHVDLKNEWVAVINGKRPSARTPQEVSLYKIWIEKKE